MTNYRTPIYIVMFGSVTLVVFGFLVAPDQIVTNTYVNTTDIKTIFFSVGTSLLASSCFALFTIRKISKEEKRIALFEKMGLLHFYTERDEITERCTELFNKAEIVDITAIRLRTLLEKHEERLTNLLKTKSLRIRILMPNPDSDSARTIEELLGTKQSIRAGLKNVLDWQKRLTKEKLRGTLEIRYSDQLISSMYQRIDNILFTGPYMNKKDSQGTFTLECDAFGEFGKILSKYFDDRFAQSSLNLRTRPFVVEFLGMPGAGKTTCVNFLKGTYKEIYSHSNEDVPCFKEDTPFQFNDRLIDSLSEIIQKVGTEGILFLDRGIEDLKIWLKTHKLLSNLDDKEYNDLLQQIPKLPTNIKHYKVLFLIPPATTKKRRKIQRRIDEWAIQDVTLQKLYKAYTKRRNSKEKDFFVIDATTPENQMKEKVLKTINTIFELENNRY